MEFCAKNQFRFWLLLRNQHNSKNENHLLEINLYKINKIDFTNENRSTVQINVILIKIVNDWFSINGIQ